MGDEARLLQEILVTGDKDLTKEVALVAGKSRAWVSEQYYRNINVSVHALTAAFTVTQDPRLKRLLEPRGWELQKVIPVSSTKNTTREMLDVMSALGRLAEKLEEAEADNKIEMAEALSLLGDIGRVEIELAELKVSIGKYVDEHFYDDPRMMRPRVA